MSKPFYKSRTMWFNVITTVPLLFDAIAANSGLLQPLVPAKWWPICAVVITIGNVWLRVITTQAVEARKKDEESPGAQ